MSKILLVEDSTEFQKIIVNALKRYDVTCAESVADALSILGTQEVDLILLDISLPDRDGYSLLSELQSDEKQLNIPVICLTGKKEIADKVTAFSLGADDYIVKPFDPLELIARVDGKLKKQVRSKKNNSTLSVGDVEIDHVRHKICILKDGKKQEIELTLTEFKLLAHLAAHVDQVLSRKQLIQATWGHNTNVLERAVDVHICSLRKKISSQATAIRAVPGIGYKFILPGAQKKQAS